MKKYPTDTVFVNKVIQKIKYTNAKLGEKRYWIAAFLAGAAIEFCMVKLTVRDHNFYKSYTRKEALKEAERLLEEEQAKNQVEDLLKNTPREVLETVKDMGFLDYYFTKRHMTVLAKTFFWMFLGNQCVHMYYQPLTGFDREVQKQLHILRQQAQQEEKTDAGQA